MSESSTSDGCKIGFIGGGKMAHAIAGPLLLKKIIAPDDFIVSAKTHETLKYWKNTYNVRTAKYNYEVVNFASIIFLAVKPQYLESAIISALETIKNIEEKIFVSIAAGVTIKTLKRMFVTNNRRLATKFIRTMPNIPLCVGQGITLYCRDENVCVDDAAPVIKLFLQLGVIEEIEESLIDAAGALSGCGPAFTYLIIEALADGAVKNGLPRALAMKLAAQVLIGASRMMLETDKHPGQLKDEVCSPGGTTIAGIHQLEIGKVRGSLINAIDAAVNRSKEFRS